MNKTLFIAYWIPRLTIVYTKTKYLSRKCFGGEYGEYI